MSITDERATAPRRVEAYRYRYGPNDDSYFPIQIAIRWAEAIAKVPSDLEAMKAILDDAGHKQEVIDVAFYAFFNTMKEIYRDELRDSFNR